MVIKNIKASNVNNQIHNIHTALDHNTYLQKESNQEQCSILLS